jgi:tRNA(Ile)-lysidine synthase
MSASPLLEAIARTGEQHLIGVSGGRDSIALLHMLLQCNCRGLIVAHLDHALRSGSGAEARFVAQLAKQSGLEVVIEREKVGARARRGKQSIESAAREARYEFFARVAKARGCRRVLLAHHADDQVETFLFNLFRGAGARGLAAMRPEITRTVKGVELTILRPLLSTWRAEIDAYVARHELDFREDPSNADPKHTRNRLRHELLPMLEAIFGRDVRRSIWRTTEVLAAEDELLAAQTPVAAPEPAVAPLRLLALAMQRRVLHGWLKGRGVADVGFEEVERVRALLSGQTAKTNLPGSKHARRRAMKLIVEG